MKHVSLIAVAFFMVTCFAVGARLFGVWRRTRQLPELLLTIALWCVGVLGFALGMIARLTGGAGSFGPPIAALALSSEYTGCASLCIFAWRVFYPRSRWGAALAFGLIAVLATALAAELVSGQFYRYTDGGPISGPIVPLGLAARALGPSWVASACFRYHALLRRRLKLGLAEPAVVHRVALWGTSNLATATGYAVSVIHRSVFGTGLQAHGWALGVVSLVAFVSASSIGLAFFPPSFYRRWVGGQS